MGEGETRGKNAGTAEYQALSDKPRSNKFLLQIVDPGSWEKENIPDPPHCKLSTKQIFKNYHINRGRSIYMPPMHAINLELK